MTHSPPAPDANEFEKYPQLANWIGIFARANIEGLSLQSWDEFLQALNGALKEANATLKARIECLEKALRVYADQYCEFGPSNEGCGKFSDDICGGCRARQALQVSEGSGCELCDKGDEPNADGYHRSPWVDNCGSMKCTRNRSAR